MVKTSDRALKPLSFCSLLVAFTWGLTCFSWAQVTTATILGTVKDQSGGVLPGVTIAIANTETGLRRELVTDDAGRYRAAQLALGNYEVEASLASFQTEVRTGIKLTVGREAVVDFMLAVGEISDRIQVTGDAPLVETTNSTIAGLVDDKKIRDLPLNGRSFSDLVTLQMGAVTQPLGARNSSSGFGLKISVSGARPSENSFLLDGNFVNDTLNNTPAGVTGLFLGVETLREFTVLTNTFNAEYGQSAGAVVNAVTKSGTNELHGSLFYFHRNSALDARNFFDRQADPPFRRHQYGGVIGGPIVPNQTFFFGGYEGLREGLGLTRIIDTLTPEARLGILPGRPPIQVAPGISDYFVLYPLPNGRPKSPGAAEYLFTKTNESRQDNFVVKVDHNFSDADSTFARYTFDDADIEAPGVNYAGVLQSRNQYLTLEEKKVISPELLNIFRFGYIRSVLNQNDKPLINLPPQLQLV
ncbi:MAG: carboxypeptidase regulatory-like domain-containing protein, partial [Acidobacteria bacterium]|nr:carboxypeptidase regulatory-like domain-containing protein [Acidobacteriota bacterium]